MRILMVTNTYTPHVGGVARSIERFAGELRALGHSVLIVAPEFEDMPRDETHVVRIPAICDFRGSGFSLGLPAPWQVTEAVAAFEPELVHSHHPFLVGNTGLRIAYSRAVPIIFTHHTMYEDYTHYVWREDSEPLKRFAVELSTRYANLCDQVIAPGTALKEILRRRGVSTPIEVIPTGVAVGTFTDGDGPRIRKRFGIPREAFVVGHTGRLSPEKNLGLLAHSVAAFMRRQRGSHFLVVGSGPSAELIEKTAEAAGLAARVHLAGILEGGDLIDAYHAMDLFAFASTSETQGMVLAEAMAAGLPVVAVSASGVNDVVRDGVNGRLIPDQHAEPFADGLEEMRRHLQSSEGDRIVAGARETAGQFSIRRCAEKALAVYRSVLARTRSSRVVDEAGLNAALAVLQSEWEIWTKRLGAAAEALREL